MRIKERIQATARAAASRQGAIVILWIVFAGLSLGTMANMVGRLREREENYIRLWAYSMGRLADAEYDNVINTIVNERNSIPFIMMSERGTVERSNLVSDNILRDPVRLDRKISQLESINRYIAITLRNGNRYFVFYGRSKTLSLLTWFPVAQVIALGLLLWLWIVTFRSSKSNEQNRVWVGLAKETAHQLGTPTSSLLGWVEDLKTQPVDQETVAEMDKDLTHLMKIADRFSKIGSDTPLEPTSINELVGEAVMYFRKRIPRNVELDYNGLAMAPLRARINPALFEWVIENLLKNALDALQGHGVIDVKLSRDDRNIYIDVADTGRGIARANREKIFEPGFTTKTRGWGLGLSLSKRVIEEYHKGRIFVAESEVGRGTVMRVALKAIP
jgi:signal transduction histidine kinase